MKYVLESQQWNNNGFWLILMICLFIVGLSDKVKSRAKLPSLHTLWICGFIQFASTSFFQIRMDLNVSQNWGNDTRNDVLFSIARLDDVWVARNGSHSRSCSFVLQRYLCAPSYLFKTNIMSSEWDWQLKNPCNCIEFHEHFNSWINYTATDVGNKTLNVAALFTILCFPLPKSIIALHKHFPW